MRVHGAASLLVGGLCFLILVPFGFPHHLFRLLFVLPNINS
eukprot:SAG11_NODE_4143_length_2042_cov_1.680391_1_plen_40_part_10